MHDEDESLDLLPRRKSVLLVERDILLRAAAAEALRQAGLVVFEAASADEARSMVAADLIPDLLFTEIGDPAVGEGLRLAERLKAVHPGMAVFVTSSELDARVDAIVTQRFLRKPYDVEAMVSLVRKALGV